MAGRLSRPRFRVPRHMLKEEQDMKSTAILSAAIGALAAAFVAVPANALPAVPGKLTAANASDAVQTVRYGEYRRGHHRGIRLFFGGGRRHGGWGNYNGWRGNYGRRAHRGYGYGYGRGDGGGHGGGHGGRY